MYVLAAPCLLDLSLRAEGITSDADREVFARALDRCREFGIEAVPLPCPETLYLGSPRQPGPLAGRLDTRAFALLLDELEVDVRGLIAERGPPLCLIGVDSSPCCGATQYFYDDARRAGRGCWLARFPELPIVDVAAFSKYRVYLAAPLFSAAERSFNDALAAFLHARYLRVFVPQAQGDDSAGRCSSSLRTLFDRLVAALDASDVVVSVIDGADPDSGVAWEMGYAYAHGIPVVSLRTDFRRVGDCECANLMLECSSEVTGSLDELTALLGALPPKEEG